MEYVVCNRCGKQIKVEKGIAKEDYLHVRKDWGYFSNKDGFTQEFILCEKCVEMVTRDFVLPAAFRETKELL